MRFAHSGRKSPVTFTLGITFNMDTSTHRTRSVMASAVGLVLLVALVTLAAAVFESGRGFWFAAIAGYLFTIPFAIAAWHGNLWKNGEGPRTPAQWLQFFAMSAALSAVFVLIDKLVVHPGLSLIFTFGALSMAFIALPGAARAWLLEALSAGKPEQGGGDA